MCYTQARLVNDGWYLYMDCPHCHEPVSDHLTNHRQSQVRFRIGAIHGWMCRYCGVLLPEGGGQLEHVVPQSNEVGGHHLWRETNYVLACQPCNGSKGAQDPVAWFMKLRARAELWRAPLLAGFIVEMLQAIDGPMWNPRSNLRPPLDLWDWLERGDDDPPEHHDYGPRFDLALAEVD